VKSKEILTDHGLETPWAPPPAHASNCPCNPSRLPEHLPPCLALYTASWSEEEEEGVAGKEEEALGKAARVSCTPHDK